jgi:hypothetical protein
MAKGGVCLFYWLYFVDKITIMKVYYLNRDAVFSIYFSNLERALIWKYQCHQL